MKIGFEIHEQLATRRKLYCDCPTKYRDALPNTNVCPICTGMPGAKPAPPNRKAIDSAIEVALMLDCKVIIDEPIYIQRKHYDYPDLPSGYQRTSLPIAKNGKLEGIRIREVHIEEDPGKYDPARGTVDYNRSGVPLVEIVTEADISSPEESRKFLRSLMRVLEFSEKVRPEPGTMRVDTNISIKGGARVEIKNINSVKGAYRALKYEIMRQRKAMKREEGVTRETRAYLETQMITIPMRTKEAAEDYRYIPDPDIFPIVIERNRVERIGERMHEPPHLRERRISKDYRVKPSVARILVGERKLADLFESVAQEINPEFTSKWFKDSLKKVLNYMGMSASDAEFTPRQMVRLLKMIEKNKLTLEQGELVLREMVKSPTDPEKLVKDLGFWEFSIEELRRAVDRAIAKNKKAVEDFKSGKEEALNFLTGEVMKITENKADPREVTKLLRERLSRG